MISRTRTSVVVLHNNSILAFFAIDPKTGKEYHFLPGGAIEAGETAPEAAERETFEETGYQVTVDTEGSVDKEYLFDWDGQTYNSLTIFYRGRLKNPFQTPKQVKDADYNKGVVWVPRVKIHEVFGYTNEIRDAILQLTENL